jgi:hypothetical protein
MPKRGYGHMILIIVLAKGIKPCYTTYMISWQAISLRSINPLITTRAAHDGRAYLCLPAIARTIMGGPSSSMGGRMKDSYVLLGLLQKRAPTSVEQATLSNEYNKIPTEEERFKWAVCALADGILYGNWPW